MRWDGRRESENVEDRRGGGGFPMGRAGGIGVGTIVLALVAMFFGVDPGVVLQNAPVASVEPAPQRGSPAPDGRNDELKRFVSVVLADTEDTWTAVFQAAGKKYEVPKLVLYSGAVRSACGLGQAAMGPFYCPGDRKLYVDLQFYDDLKRRFRAPGDFAQAYVIAHEVGHHVQTLLGISDKVQSAQARATERQSNAIQVRMELQADCFAGVWANRTDKVKNILESGDVEEALNAASAIGDDRLQKQGQGYVVPESFTHGSSDQRVRWFRAGLESGDMKRCDTFAARQL